MQTGASYWRWGLGLALTGAAVASLLIFAPQPDLLARAMPTGPRPADTNLWLSDHELLCFRQVRSSPTGNRWAIYRHDVKTRRGTDLPGLTQRFNLYPGNPPETATVSPDGKWLLWRAGRTTRATTLDGT